MKAPPPSPPPPPPRISSIFLCNSGQFFFVPKLQNNNCDDQRTQHTFCLSTSVFFLQQACVKMVVNNAILFFSYMHIGQSMYFSTSLHKVFFMNVTFAKLRLEPVYCISYLFFVKRLSFGFGLLHQQAMIKMVFK